MNGRERYFKLINLHRSGCCDRMAQWLKSTLISLEEVGMRVQIPAWQLPFFFSFIVFLPFGFLLFILTATLLASRDFCENVFLVYIRFIDKHYITFCSIASISNAFYAKLCSSWKGIKTRVERQTTMQQAAMFVSHILEKRTLSTRSEHQSPL